MKKNRFVLLKYTIFAKWFLRNGCVKKSRRYNVLWHYWEKIGLVGIYGCSVPIPKITHRTFLTLDKLCPNVKKINQ